MFGPGGPMGGPPPGFDPNAPQTPPGMPPSGGGFMTGFNPGLSTMPSVPQQPSMPSYAPPNNATGAWHQGGLLNPNANLLAWLLSVLGPMTPEGR